MKKLLRIALYVFFPKLKKGASVLMYHSVDTNKAFFNVLPKDFEKQMKYLQKNGLRVIPLSELFQIFRDGGDMSSCVSITFDDGYESVIREAMPILKKYGMHASIFVSSGLLGTNYTTSDGANLQIFSLDKFKEEDGFRVFELLSHTCNHHELPSLPRERIEQELAQDLDFLSIENSTPRIVAYPRGKFSDEVLSVLKQEEWQGAVTTIPGLFTKNSNPLLVPRNFVGRPTSLLEFKTLLSDGVYYYARLRLWFSGLSKKF